MERRDFVKTGLAATTGTILLSSFPGCQNIEHQQGNLNRFIKGFREPPSDARLFVRWWWNGNRLTGNEILRELDVMKAAGIGGVEINPIAFPQDCDPSGYESMTMFEDNWLDMLEIALKGAKERGIICDMIVGSGWPFGGEFLKKEEQTQMVTIETIDLEGNQQVRFSESELLDRIDPEIHSKHDKVYKDLLIARLVPAYSKTFTEGKDLTAEFGENGLTIDVPAGKYVLYYVIKLTGYMAVINGAPGAAGPVLNHYNKLAVENYLNRISGHITGKIGDMGNYIRAMFCDSMELEGANWNDDLPYEFEKRRGYSLLPYLPYVLKNIGHMGNPLDEKYGTEFSEEVEREIARVGLDLYTTRIELFKERFIDTFNDWCHKNNVLSRAQAYGRGYHPLEASMEIDIPECETWLNRSVGKDYPETGLAGRAPTMVNKYVASGAVLGGRKIISCEEITNTTMVFMASLENIKIAGDQSNISGVNHSILHGFNYSPADIPFPGWVQYGTWYNERNTWWPWFRQWSDYKARISYLLQNASPQANIAVLQPLLDLWLKKGPQRDPFPKDWYPEYQNNIWEAIHQNGGGCDYVSEKIINNAEFNDGRMIHGDREYNALILPEIETISVETVQKIKMFADAGGKLIFISKTPFRSPAFLNYPVLDEEVRSIINDLIGSDKKNVIIYPAPEDDPITWFGKLQKDINLKPYVQFSKTDKYLSQSSFKLGDNPMFFIANTSLDKTITVNAEFLTNEELLPWLWDPETGEKWRYPIKGKNNAIELYLPPATSRLILFEKDRDGEMFFQMKPESYLREISGSWDLKLNHVDGNSYQIEMLELKDLIEDNRTKNFAGTVVYDKRINLDNKEYRYLDLGEVKGISELFVNGEFLGTRWYGAHLYNIQDYLVEGENEISIRLTTITGNYLKGETSNPVAQRWTGRQPYISMGIMGPVRLGV
ncbi:MAG: hypothetical protein IH594_05500 [Bacteroidales bacterium]|nr:hypothetical protein [Bacteroidales bacterium]